MTERQLAQNAPGVAPALCGVDGSVLGVIVTRPERDARHWVAQLQHSGFAAEALPLIEIAPASGAANQQALRQAWGDPATAEASAGVLAAAPAPLVQVQKIALVNNYQQAEALGEAVAAELRAGGAVWAANAPAA